MQLKKVLCVVLAGVLLIGSVSSVRADSIEERQQKANELESQKNQAQAAAVALSGELNQIIAQMEQTQASITQKEAEIVQKEDELMYAQIDENNQYNSMKKRIKYMYENGNTQFIEILFESKSIGELLNNAEYIAQISEYDRQMLVEFQAIVASVEQQQAALEQERQQLVVLQNQLIEEQNSVSAMLQEKNIEISNLEAAIGENAKKLQELQIAAAEAARRQKEAQEAAAAAAAAAAAKQQQASANKNNGASSNTSSSTVATTPNTSTTTTTTTTNTSTSGNGKLSNPCPAAYISSEFGGRKSPGGIGSTNHKGRDYAAGTGSAILAAAGGTVTTVGYNGARGNYIVVNHGGGLATLYQHCSAIYASVGQSVGRGTTIAAVGSTGASTGPHLHFEVHVGGVPVDPRLYL